MRIFISVFLFSVAYQVSGQIHKVDSLSALLKSHPREDTTQVILLNELSLRTFRNDPEKSAEYAASALKVARLLRFDGGVGDALNNLAMYHLMKGNTELSLSMVFEAAKIGEQRQLPEISANSYAITGSVYHYQRDEVKALRYLRMAQQANRSVNNPLIASKILNTLGGLARNKREYDSALVYYQQALSIMKESGEEYRMPEVLHNMGMIYIRQDKHALAMEYYFKGLEAARKSDNRHVESGALGSIGEAFFVQKKYREAEEFMLQSIKLSKQIGDSRGLSAVYMIMMQLKNETGKFNEAHTYMASYYRLKDSLVNAERAKKIAELEIRYETEKKEHAIQILERDKKIQRLWTNILIASLILLAIASGVVYYLQRYRERKNRLILNLEIEQLTTQHNELSEKYKDVLTMGSEKSVDSHDQRILKKAIEVVENSISDGQFSVEKMAKEMGMSRTNMHRKIKAITGFPPSELIRSIRLRKAAILLLHQADSVTQISLRVGFEDHSYFSKAFKKQFGVPPSEYLQFRTENA